MVAQKGFKPHCLSCLLLRRSPLFNSGRLNRNADDDNVCVRVKLHLRNGYVIMPFFRGCVFVFGFVKPGVVDAEAQRIQRKTIFCASRPGSFLLGSSVAVASFFITFHYRGSRNRHDSVHHVLPRNVYWKKRYFLSDNPHILF